MYEQKILSIREQKPEPQTLLEAATKTTTGPTTLTVVVVVLTKSYLSKHPT